MAEKEKLPGVHETSELYTQGLYEELVNLLAMPGEVVHAIASFAGFDYEDPSEFGQRKLKDVGLAPHETEPGTVRHAIKEGGKFTAAGLAPIGVVGKLPKATSVLGKALIRPIQEAPAFETALALGSGAGAAGAGAAFPESQVAPLVGALASGGATALARPLGRPQPLRSEVPSIRSDVSRKRLPPETPAETIILDEAAAKSQLSTLTTDYEKRLTTEVHENIVAAAEELFGSTARDPKRLISDQILEMMQSNPDFNPTRFRQVLENNGIGMDDLGKLFRFDVRQAARDLGRLGALSKRLNEMMRTPGMQDALEELGGPNGRGMNFWRKLENTRRAILVTQMATAMRNMLTQQGRLGLDALQQTMDNTILRFFPDRIRAENPTNAMGALLRLYSRPGVTKSQVDQVLKEFPDLVDPMFYRYTSDINRAGIGGGAWGKVERGVQVLNAANRFQEFAIRRAVFAAHMDRLMSRDGLDLAEVLARGGVGDLDERYIKESVHKALDMTWAKDYSPFASGMEGMAGKLIQAINGTGIGPLRATVVIPFPRFMANAIEFQYQHSPLPLVKLAYSKKEWAKVAAGDVSTISKGTIGVGMFLSAWQFRNSDYAGERWYEVRNPRTGEMIDTRAYNPFASYLFVAEMVRRSMDNTLPSLTTREVFQGALSVNLRAGAGLYVADKMLEGLAGVIGSGEKAGRAGKEFAGEWLGSFAVPLQQLRDLVAQFDESQRVIRERRAAPFLGPIATKIPYGADLLKLPEVEIPTRIAPPRMVDPFVRQVTGLSFKEPRNPAERELARLKFDRLEILPASGVPEWDRAIAHEMGKVVERVISPVVEQDNYKSLPNAEKANELRLLLIEARSVSSEAAAFKHPKLAAKARYQKQSKRKRAAAKSAANRGDMERAIEIMQGR